MESGQKVKITSGYFAGQTGILRGYSYLHEKYFVQMKATGHVLPFLPNELAAPTDIPIGDKITLKEETES